MASSIDGISHGLHNVAVCEYLFLKPEFSDWVITTAFYASLHLISSCLFPYAIKAAIGGKEIVCNNVDDYKRFKGRNSPDKHSLICDLAFEKCREDIATKYKWLYDTCRNARYVNYQQDPQIAQCAKSRMIAIRDYILKQTKSAKK